MLENIKLAFQGIWGHKMRSLLTMLGIIIGIASIISIVSTIKGTNEQIKQNLIGSGTNAVTIKLYNGDYELELDYETVPDNLHPLTEAVRSQLAAIDKVEDVSFFLSRSYNYNTYYKNTQFNGAIFGIDKHYLNVNGYQVSLGRGFSAKDYSKYKKVCLIDEDAMQAIGIEGSPIGQVLEIAKEPYVIIGMVSLSSSYEPVINSMSDYYTYMSSSNGKIFIPDVQWSTIFKYDEPQGVCLKTSSTDDMTAAGKAATDLINSTLDPNLSLNGSTLKYKSSDLTEQAQNLQSLSNSTNMQLIWIASISLLVGGIGVMNIMLVSVTERTREIGLKKAIGAKESRILLQFLTEAGVLTSFGGILGVLSGIGMSKVISSLTGAPTAISIGASIIAVVFSMMIGLIFGLLPAVKAARLNPIDALRRE